MHAIPKLRRLVVVTTATGRSHVPFEDGRGGIDASSDLVSTVTIGAGCGRKIAFPQDGLSVDTLLEQRHNPRPCDSFPGDDIRIGMAAGAGFVNLGAMDRRQRIVTRLDGVSCVARHAGGQVPGFLHPADGVDTGRRLLGLPAMARRADDIGIGAYLLNPMAVMTGNTVVAGTAATQLGMSTLRYRLMGHAMACAAPDRPRRVGVRPF